MKSKNYVLFEYLGVIALWLIMFGKNIFSNLLFVDYMPVTSGFLFRNLVVSNYTSSINLLTILRELFSLINLPQLFFTFSILFAMLLSYFYISRLIQDKKRYLFALIFFFNPFVYTRIIIGQVGILIAYFLTPIFVYYLFKMFESNLELKSILKTALTISIISSMAPHFLVINGIIFLVASFWFYFYKNPNKDLKKYSKTLLIFIALILLLNLYWLQGMFAGGILGEIDQQHENFFAPKMSPGVSAISKVFLMYGFWREVAHKTTYSMIPLWAWYSILILFITLLIYGYQSSSHDKKSKTIYSLFWIGLLLGVGISHPFTKSFVDFLFRTMPFFNGLRDSHKLVLLVAFSYAYFLPIALTNLDKLFKNKSTKIIINTCLVLLIFGLTFPMINMGNQLRHQEYPQEYFQLNDYLNSQQIQGDIIFLPWEGYLTYNWSRNVSSDGRIGAFANAIMDNPVLTGPDTYGGNTGRRLEVSKCLNNESIDCLENLGVEYVIYDNCALYQNKYEWLRQGPKEFQGECTELYNIQGFKERTKIPFRFIVTFIISLISFVLAIYLLVNGQSHKKPL